MRTACTLLIAVLWGCEGERVAAPASSAAAAPDAGRADETDQSGEGFIGVVVPQETFDATFQLGGVVAELPVEMGARVTKGEVLAALDGRPLQQELAMADAAVRGAYAGVSQARADAEEAREKEAIARELLSRELGSKQDLATATHAATRARARLLKAQAELDEQRARLVQLQTQLSETRLLAPFSGTVAVRFVHPGAVVAAGKPVLRLIRTDELRVRFAIPEGPAVAVKPGEPVRIRVGSPARELRGVVRHVAPEIDTASRTIFAEAELVTEGAEGQAPELGEVCRVLPGA